MTTLKKIEWSYPTSTNATKFGFGKTGCYTVETMEHRNAIPNAVAGFKTIAGAEIHAAKLPYDWHRLTRRAATETGKD